MYILIIELGYGMCTGKYTTFQKWSTMYNKLQKYVHLQIYTIVQNMELEKNIVLM